MKRELGRSALFVLGGAALVAGGLVLYACGVGTVAIDDPEFQDELDRTVITEHRFREGEPPLREETGGPCETYGARQCRGGVCIAVAVDGSGQNGGYVCSLECASNSDCPETWSCVQTYPGPGSSFCLPPSSAALADEHAAEEAP